MSKDIFLTNSFGNKKEQFIPINSKKIGMYVCGPTVYDDPHIGNARPLVVLDLLFKVLKIIDLREAEERPHTAALVLLSKLNTVISALRVIFIDNSNI